MTSEATGSAVGGARVRVRFQGTDRLLDSSSSYRIGRDPQSDILVNDPRVSWNHAVLQHQDGGWVLEDPGSTNGTFVDSERVRRVAISGDCSVRLGHPADGPQLTCTAIPDPRPGTVKVQSPTARWAGEQAPAPPVSAQPVSAQPVSAQPVPEQRVPQQRVPAPAAAAAPAVAPPQWGGASRPPSAVLPMPARSLRIGRASDNDVVVSDLGVSRYHAELRRTSRGDYEIVDLDSHNGTYLNGQRIKVAPVTETDLIAVGPATFRRVDDQLQEFLDTGDISLSARELTFRLPNGKVLLDNVTFPLGERCLLGVIGPSGAGKSTLLGALTGIAPATDGNVLYDGRDLYKSYAELRHRIGLVPQENILHTQLTVRRALEFAAELRFPRDTSKQERKRRIDEVLGELALTAHADTRTSALSGGQQKRVNVALELLTKPSLLFLDEPTSGLDPGLDKSVMEQMAKLAHDGRTVIVVTHSVANLNLCDRLLVLVPGGKIAFFGPPADGLRHFGKSDWAEVFQMFESQPGRDWAAEFRSSAYHNRYITAELNNAAVPSAATREIEPAPRTRNGFAHLRTMCRRYLAVIASDRLYLGVLAGLPVGLGLLVRVIPSPHGLLGPDNVDATSLLLVLSVGAVLSGTANAIWEIVKERSIYSRERAAGLSAGAYLVSKLVILGVMSGLQAVILVAVGLTGRQLPKQGTILAHLPLVEIMLAMFVLGIGSMTLGLLLSSVVDTSEKAMPLLVLVVMAQVVLSGGIFPVHTVGVQQASWLSPSRWGYAASAATVDLNHVIPPANAALGAAPRGRAAVTGRAGSTTTIARVSGAKHKPAKPNSSPSATPSGAVTGSPTGPATGAGTTASSNTDPLWDHTVKTWLTDMIALLLLAVAYSILTWWRLAKMGPVRRR